MEATEEADQTQAESHEQAPATLDSDTNELTAEGPKTEVSGPETEPKSEAEGQETSKFPTTGAQGIESSKDPTTDAQGIESSKDPTTDAQGIESSKDPTTDAQGIESPKDPASATEGIETANDSITDAEGIETSKDPITDAEGIETTEGVTSEEGGRKASEITDKSKGEEGTASASEGTGDGIDAPAKERRRSRKKSRKDFFKEAVPSTGTLAKLVAREMMDESQFHKDSIPRYSLTTPNSVVMDAAANVQLVANSKKRSGGIMPAEVIYKPAAAIIQDPTLPLCKHPCLRKMPGGSLHGARVSSNRQIIEMHRQNLLEYRTLSNRRWDANPTATVPMRVARYTGKKHWEPPLPSEDWKDLEERDKDRRDHMVAKELGYETLVGNIQYITIPGARDLQRSWLNFLSADEMEWGFPYHRGSLERPRMRQPEPYLAHQVKERLWRYPRSKMIQAMHDDSTIV